MIYKNIFLGDIYILIYIIYIDYIYNVNVPIKYTIYICIIYKNILHIYICITKNILYIKCILYNIKLCFIEL